MRKPALALAAAAMLAAVPQAQAHDRAGVFIAGAVTGVIVGSALAPRPYVGYVYAPPPPPVAYYYPPYPPPPVVVYSPPPRVVYYGPPAYGYRPYYPHHRHHHHGHGYYR